MSTRYKCSEELLERALRTIPLGSQTFSKSKTQLPHGVSPFFVERADGAMFWDVDGNEYIDFTNALASVLLGYRDPDVDSAVRAQMENGVTFSLPHTLEMEVAEILVELIPCAEKVRFAKNGTDATSGAIRVARAYTGRERVAVCGYHGWQDWYIGSTTRDLGVPKGVKALTHPFTYNNSDSLKQLFDTHPGEFAAVILEPMSGAFPENGFLERVRSLASEHGALLVFDETVTGFRFSLGGAQELFGVTPDLATFGKGVANGYPLSALVGKTEYMDVVEKVFFSGTFGGETLSLAAAKAVITKLRTEPVLPTLKARGDRLLVGVNQLIADLDMADLLSVCGHPTWSFLVFKDTQSCTMWEAKTYFMQEMLKRGIFTIGVQTLSYAHTDNHISQLLKTYREVFGQLVRLVRSGELQAKMECAPLDPLFKVR
jgi:glutamate-1-semialdehyde aminotransferase